MNDRDRFYLYCLSFLNIPYHWGGANPLTGLDCSELAQALMGYFGLDPTGDQNADTYYRHFHKHGAVVALPDLGTLLFFGSPDHVTHVAIALDGQRMIEAGGGGSKVTSPEIAAKKGAYVKVSRINRRADLVARIHPAGLPW